MGLFPPLSTTSVSRIKRELGGLEECVYCCGQYMVQLQTGWRSGISPTGYGIAGKPREGWVWPVQAQRGNMRARKDYYGGDGVRKTFFTNFSGETHFELGLHLDLVHHTIRRPPAVNFTVNRLTLV